MNDYDLDITRNMDGIMELNMCALEERGINTNTCTPYQIFSLFLDSQF